MAVSVAIKFLPAKAGILYSWVWDYPVTEMCAMPSDVLTCEIESLTSTFVGGGPSNGHYQRCISGRLRRRREYEHNIVPDAQYRSGHLLRSRGVRGLRQCSVLCADAGLHGCCFAGRRKT